MTRLIGLLAMVPALTLGAGLPAFAADKYQFMKATENRVWRLNRETGEVAVCALRGERLTCIASSEAPPRGGAERQGRNRANRAEEKAVREKQEEKNMMKILARVFGFFKEMIAISREETVK